jgi:predicted CoA-substrate-specific enzyme activase
MTLCGIDVGSRTTKAVLLDGTGKVLSRVVQDSGADLAEAAGQVYQSARAQAGLREGGGTRSYVLATGYGRRLVSFADDVVTEISCHARGAVHLFPDARSVLDIGGQDSKLILLGPEGAVKDFSMNERCAAGTGRFLELAGAILGIPLRGMGEVSRGIESPAVINSTCVVFAESEVIGLVSQGRRPAEILAGLHYALVKQIISLLGSHDIESPLIFTGGVALNEGMVRALRETVRCEVRVPEFPQTVGALGAALIAESRARGRQERSDEPQ